MKPKMIYDTDPYLMPFKDAIEARHGRIQACRDRFAADGSLSAHYEHTVALTENGPELLTKVD